MGLRFSQNPTTIPQAQRDHHADALFFLFIEQTSVQMDRWNGGDSRTSPPKLPAHAGDLLRMRDSARRATPHGAVTSWITGKGSAEAPGRRHFTSDPRSY